MHAESDAAFPAEAYRRKARITAELERHPFRPAWWLRNRHLQTVWGPLLRRPAPPTSRLERWATPDNDFLRLHFCDGDPACPTVLLLHGLEGCAQSSYIVGLSQAFHARNWNVVTMEFRGCGGELNRAPRLYHSGETSDLDFVVGALIARRPGIRLYLAGISLGGNVTAKWLGEVGQGAPENVRAAAVVSPPFDLTQSARYLENRLGRFYTRWFLRTLIPKALEKEGQYPGVVDPERVRRSKTFADFDNHSTAPLHGFRDALDYWARSSCGPFLDGIRRPTLLLISEDDPFNPISALPHDVAKRSPYLIPQFTRQGGHVGFVQGGVPWRGRYWAEEQIVRFFERCSEEE